MRVGYTAQVEVGFSVVVTLATTATICVDALEMGLEKGNENDLLLHVTQLIDIASKAQTPRVLRDQQGYAEIVYTVSVTPLP